MSESNFYNDVLLKHKKMSDLQYVFSLYSDVTLFLEYKMNKTNITDIHLRLYYMLLEQMIEKHKYSVIDSVNMELFISKQSDKLQKLYNEAGGWATIEESLKLIEPSNVGVYYEEVLRYEALRKLYKQGYDIESKWSSLVRLSYQELAATMEGGLAEAFPNLEGEERVVDFKDGIEKMIEEADKGALRGLPVTSRMLNSTLNGLALGNITMLAGTSGVGKTNVTLNQALPNMIETGEPLLIICNEEELGKWQQELLTWIINNHLDGDFIKSRFYQGKFHADEKLMLVKAKEWMFEKMEDGLIQFINFNTFSMDKTIRLMRRYIIQENIRYFIIDTLKLDNDIGSTVSDNSWLKMQQNVVKLYNLIKPSAYNCHVWTTYQMSKGQRTRYLDQSNLGISKNVADVAATLLLIRDVLDTEKGDDAKALHIKKNSKEPPKPILLKENDYIILFVDKNRRGAAKTQMVFKIDKGRNTMKDIGFTTVSEDY